MDDGQLRDALFGRRQKMSFNDLQTDTLGGNSKVTVMDGVEFSNMQNNLKSL